MSQHTERDGSPQPGPSSNPRRFMRSITERELFALTSAQKGMISTMRQLELDESIGAENLKGTIAEMFPPAILFSQELRDLPAIYSELRDFLDSRGANMTQHSSRRVMMTLATNLYEEQEDTVAATEIVQDLIASGRRRNLHSTSANVPARAASANNQLSTADSGSEKVAHNVAMRLKDNEKKFSGDLGENWMEYVDEYFQIAKDYNLTPDQRLQYLHNVLRGDAKRFYLGRVDGYAANYQQAIEMINNEYNSPVRQTRVKNYLNSLRLRSLETKGIETSAALAQVYKIITKFSRQVPRSHQGDAHKIEFLRNAVVGYSWSHEPLSRVPTHNLTFQMLYGELEAALQLHKEAKLAKLRDTAEGGNREASNDVSSVFYQGQGRYMRNTSNFRRPKYSRETSPAEPKKPFNPLSIQGCFNCESPDHVVKDCPQRLNVAKAAARKIDYYSRKGNGSKFAVHHVLADLCVQLDADRMQNEIGDDCDLDDINVFESLLTYQDPRGGSPHETETLVSPEEAEHLESNKVYIINFQHANVREPEFLGACIDSAAQRTVIRKPQAELYSKRCGFPLVLKPSANISTFSFGTHRHQALGRMEVRVPIQEDHFLPLVVDVVNIDIPFLLGLDTMRMYGMVLDTDREVLSSNFEGWKVPLVPKLGHLYLEWDIAILFTEAELRKVHRHFFHPKSERLYALLRRADPESTSPKVLQDLEKIDRTCDPCQRHASSPHRFRVSLPAGEIVFNREVCLDLMTLDRETVLHVVDRDTKFNCARFLKDETAETAWSTFCEMWVSTYLGYPDIVSADQGPQFRSQYWRDASKLVGVHLKLSGVEGHNALNVGETYHEFLRRIFHKAKEDNPNAGKEELLVSSIKALNDTAGPNGLVPTLLVFGVLPRIPFLSSELPSQVQRMKALESARREMNKLVAESRLKKALTSNAPGASMSSEDVKIGSEVLVFREKPINKWTGPFPVLDVGGKMCVLDVNGRQSKFSIDKVKLYRRSQARDYSETAVPSLDNAVVSNPNLVSQGLPNANDHDNVTPQDTTDSLFPSTGPTTSQLPPDEHHPLDDPEVMEQWKQVSSRTLGDELQKEVEELEDLRLNDVSVGELFEEGVFKTNITQVLKANDPRGEGSEFDTAKQEEITGIKNRNIFDIVKSVDVPDDANVLGGRFVLAYKNHGSSQQVAKARYVAQGHKDTEKGFVVHNVTNLRVSSTRILLSVAAIKGFRIYSDDVCQAYLQNEHPLSRDIYLLPKRQDRKFFDLQGNEMLKLNKPIYGVTDAGDYWDVTFHRHIKEDLGLLPSVGDQALYRKPNEDDVDGLMAVYVDDKATAGNEAMQALTERTAKRFESKPRTFDEFDFFGMHLKDIGNSSFSIEQKKYIEKLRPLPDDCTYEEFRSHRAMFAWIGLTRPDMAFNINQFAQVTSETFSKEKIDQLSKSIRDVKETIRRNLIFRPLNKSDLHLRVYADSSFANNEDLSTQIGFIVLLCDSSNACHVLEFASKKCKRVVRSVLGAEIYAASEAFDTSYLLKRNLEEVFKQEIPLHLFTDSKSMFDVLVKGSSTTEKRLMIDIRVLREAYKKHEISHVGLVSSSHNAGDGFTKAKPNAALLKIFDTGFDFTPVEQWIYRTNTSSKEREGV